MSRAELIFWLIVLAALYGYAGWLTFREWRAKRDARTDELMRRGMRSAWRRGYLTDNDQ